MLVHLPHSLGGGESAQAVAHAPGGTTEGRSNGGGAERVACVLVQVVEHQPVQLSGAEALSGGVRL